MIPTYLIDTAFPFGSRLAPGHFNRITQAVRRMMTRLGHTKLIAYLDDFLIVGDTQIECLEALNTLIFLLRDLGFSIAWDKVAGPSQSIVFLGVQIDSVKACLELPPDKLIAFHGLVKDTLLQRRLSLKQLQVLAGKLNWAAAVVRGGRVYLRRVLDMMRPMHAFRHKALISDDMREDLLWWDNFLTVFNGKSWFHPTSRWVNVYTDASGRGGGMVWGQDWAFVDWDVDFPEAAESHINVKETLAIGLAVRKWAPQWTHASVVIHTDSITARAAINKGKSRSPLAMKMVREIFWWSSIFDFKIRAVHIQGKLNITADAVSRLHSPASFLTLIPYWGLPCPGFRSVLTVFFLLHMSLSAFLSIFPQVVRWSNKYSSLIER